MSNIHCKVCHMEFSDENTICPGCGRPVDQAHPPAATEPEPAAPATEPVADTQEARLAAAEAGDDQGPGITIGGDGPAEPDQEGSDDVQPIPPA